MENARFIKVSAEVRYWEDTYLNGEEDTEGKIPLRMGKNWTPVIDLDNGRVMDWPEGITADVHYKVCDQGEYWLLDRVGNEIAKYKSHYVPDDILCVGDNGYGDYIIFNIGGDGLIANWRKPDIDPDQWEGLK